MRLSGHFCVPVGKDGNEIMWKEWLSQFWRESNLRKNEAMNSVRNIGKPKQGRKKI